TRNDLDSEYRQNSTQNLLTVDMFHYLNVPQIDMITPYDDFECVLKCLHHPLCISVNLAADGNKWCTLLSSNKFNDPEEYKGNKTSHHYYFASPCISKPCQNGGTCVLANHKLEIFECICKTGYAGELCEATIVLPQNCSQAPKKTGVYKISNHGSDPFPVYCDQTSDGGGWTMIFKYIGGMSSSPTGKALWGSSDTLSENITAALDTTATYQGHYKNRLVQSWQAFNPQEVRVVLYTNGAEVMSMTFNARGTTYMNWFSQNNLLQSPWTDLKNVTAIAPFRINGHYGARSFEITASYAGCANDIGWFMIGGSDCTWERFHPVPAILYSKKTHKITWNDTQADVGGAEVMIVYVR
ncbi:hypothetical protein AWC38_SpisGene23409, partial [Stylophora pistillata]